MPLVPGIRTGDFRAVGAGGRGWAGTRGRTADQYAVEAGADEAAISAPIEDKIYEQWITNATDEMSQNGVTGTPTVFIDGERVEGSTQESVDAVLAEVG